jgi:HK97 family phage portal protein
MGLLARRKTEDRALRPIEQPVLTSELPLISEPIREADQYNALRISDAYACVRVLADSVASLPVRADRDTPQGLVEAGPDSRIQRLLDRPSPGSTSADLFSQIMVHLNVAGNAFLGKFRGGDGEIVQLGLLDPNTVQVELHGQQIVYRVWLPNQDTSEFGRADILHIKAMTGLDGLRGLSPVTQARLALTLSANLQEASRQFFANGSRPSGILRVAGPQSEYTIERVREQWSARHQGPENMHRVAVLSGEATFTPVAFSADDSQFLQQRELSAREVARVFNIPSWMIDAEQSSSRTYANVTQQNLAFVTHSLRPWLTRIERAFTADADLCIGGLYLKFELDGLLRGDPDLRSQIYERALGDNQHPG